MHSRTVRFLPVEAPQKPNVSKLLIENLHGDEWVLKLSPKGQPVTRGTYEACFAQSWDLQKWAAGGAR